MKASIINFFDLMKYYLYLFRKQVEDIWKQIMKFINSISQAQIAVCSQLLLLVSFFAGPFMPYVCVVSLLMLALFIYRTLNHPVHYCY